MTIKISTMMPIVLLLATNVQAMRGGSRVAEGGAPEAVLRRGQAPAPTDSVVERSASEHLSEDFIKGQNWIKGQVEMQPDNTTSDEDWIFLMKEIHSSILTSVNDFLDEEGRINGVQVASMLGPLHPKIDSAIKSTVARQYASLYNNWPPHLLKRHSAPTELNKAYSMHKAKAVEMMRSESLNMLLPLWLVACFIPLPGIYRLRYHTMGVEWSSPDTAKYIDLWAKSRKTMTAVRFLGIISEQGTTTPLNGNPADTKKLYGTYFLFTLLFAAFVYAAILYSQYYIAFLVSFCAYMIIMHLINRYTLRLMM